MKLPHSPAEAMLLGAAGAALSSFLALAWAVLRGRRDAPSWGAVRAWALDPIRLALATTLIAGILWWRWAWVAASAITVVGLGRAVVRWRREIQAAPTPAPTAEPTYRWTLNQPTSRIWMVPAAQVDPQPLAPNRPRGTMAPGDTITVGEPGAQLVLAVVRVDGAGMASVLRATGAVDCSSCGEHFLGYQGPVIAGKLTVTCCDCGGVPVNCRHPPPRPVPLGWLWAWPVLAWAWLQFGWGRWATAAGKAAHHRSERSRLLARRLLPRR